MKEEKKLTNNKAVIAKTIDGNIYKVFTSVKEAAEFFGVSVPSMSNKISIKKFYNLKDLMLTFQTKSIGDGLDRLYETEDDTRRRLGLNPYGEWRTDEWINAMVDRVNKEHFPNGFNERLEFQRRRGYQNQKASMKRKKESEEENYELEETDYNINE